jgi:hypothetical protein
MSSAQDKTDAPDEKQSSDCRAQRDAPTRMQTPRMGQVAEPTTLASAWQHRGNSQIVRCVRSVQKTGRFGRSGSRQTYLASLHEVEGLVGLTPRGGSSPLERIGSSWKSADLRPWRTARAFPLGGPWQRRGNRRLCSMGLMTTAGLGRPTKMAGGTILGALAPLAVYLAARAARGKRKHAQVGRAGLDAR